MKNLGRFGLVAALLLALAAFQHLSGVKAAGDPRSLQAAPTGSLIPLPAAIFCSFRWCGPMANLSRKLRLSRSTKA